MLRRPQNTSLIAMFLGVVFLSVSTTIAQTEPIEQGWKGINAFVSSRKDVEKVAGDVSTTLGGDFIYRTPEGNMVVTYSGTPCSDVKSLRGSYNLPRDHVIRFDVYLKNPIAIEDLKWAKDRYSVSESPTHPYWRSYYNVKDSVRIHTDRSTGKTLVHSLSFASTPEQERKYACGSGQ